MRNTGAALVWIVDILKKLNIPFQISGGFAAQLYGANRPLADIDIDIPEENFPDLLPEVSRYITYGPEQYQDESWDLWRMTLYYQGQEIDLCGANQAKLFDTTTQQWTPITTDFSKTVPKEAFGLVLPVMSKAELIDYKSKTNREVDQEDVKCLRN